jgi:hypothetical protein
VVWRWLATTLAFLLFLPFLMLLLFLVQIPAEHVSHGLEMWFYDAAFSVFPSGCPPGTPKGCLDPGWWPANWSLVIWLVAAIGFGGLSYRWSIKKSIMVGLLLIAAIMIAMQLTMPLLGWNHFIDTI